MKVPLILTPALVSLIACSTPPVRTTSTISGASEVPGLLLGEFDDDYGSRYTISAAEWIQHPTNRYRIVRWVYQRDFLIAQNDSANPTAPGKWTRIDWVKLQRMAPYEWAFCFSAFDAPTAQAAESVSVARPSTPRTGCNGYPYTRMRRRSLSP